MLLRDGPWAACNLQARALQLPARWRACCRQAPLVGRVMIIKKVERKGHWMVERVRCTGQRVSVFSQALHKWRWAIIIVGNQLMIPGGNLGKLHGAAAQRK